MSSPIELAPQTNPALAASLTLPWLPAVALALLIPGLGLPVKIVLALSLLSWALLDARRLACCNGIAGLRVTADQPEVRFRDGGWQAAEIRAASRLFARLVILKLTVGARRKHLTLILTGWPPVANVDADRLRAFRGWLHLTNPNDRSNRAP